MRFATARSSSAGSVSIAGSVSGTSTSTRPWRPDRRGWRARRARSPRHRRACDGRSAHPPSTGSCRAGSRRGRRGGRSPRRSSTQNSRDGRRGSTRRRRRAGVVTDALIDASGVRRSCDTAASSAVRSSLRLGELVGGGGLTPELRGSATAAASWAAKACMTWRSSAAMLGAAQHEDDVVAEVDRLVGLARIGRRIDRRSRPRRANRSRSATARATESSEKASRRWWATVRSGSADAVAPTRRTSVSASATRSSASADRRRDRRDEPRHDGANGDEHDERRDVVSVVDRPAVHAAGRRTSWRTATR